MKEIYKNHAASFGSVNALYRVITGRISKKKIQKRLSGVDSHTLRKPIRRKFQTNRVIVYSIDHQRQTDLVNLISLQKYNQEYRYPLTCIDILSKYAWATHLSRNEVKIL